MVELKQIDLEFLIRATIAMFPPEQREWAEAVLREEAQNANLSD